MVTNDVNRNKPVEISHSDTFFVADADDGCSFPAELIPLQDDISGGDTIPPKDELEFDTPAPGMAIVGRVAVKSVEDEAEEVEIERYDQCDGLWNAPLVMETEEAERIYRCIQDGRDIFDDEEGIDELSQP